MNLVLLSGGSGQRLWPLSNDIRSKQFIKIFHREDGELESMVQRVYHQIKAVDADTTVTIATSKSQVSAIHNQLGEEVGISVEPCRQNISSYRSGSGLPEGRAGRRRGRIRCSLPGRPLCGE